MSVRWMQQQFLLHASAAKAADKGTRSSKGKRREVRTSPGDFGQPACCRKHMNTLPPRHTVGHPSLFHRPLLPAEGRTVDFRDERATLAAPLRPLPPIIDHYCSLGRLAIGIHPLRTLLIFAILQDASHHTFEIPSLV